MVTYIIIGSDRTLKELGKDSERTRKGLGKNSEIELNSITQSVSSSISGYLYDFWLQESFHPFILYIFSSMYVLLPVTGLSAWPR